jgi:peptidyl-tRNA hydrolase, PTH1 family
MKVVVGLGNPGSRYAGTRHNVGFRVLGELARRWGADRPKIKYEAEIVEATFAGQKVLLVAPQTFMNLSGRTVQPLLAFYTLELADLLVVCDDLNLDTGRLRLRPSGSAGGQKGLADIIQRLGSEAFSRLRIGIGRPPGQMQATDYVLGKFRADEREPIEHAIVTAGDAVEVWIKEGIGAAMNQFNAAGG